MVNNLANNLTVLGLHGVPESVREAALSCGASKWYLLTKVDLPLASPSIRAGINQTIMLSLAMVVVASLIGAKGLSEVYKKRCNMPMLERVYWLDLPFYSAL